MNEEQKKTLSQSEPKEKVTKYKRIKIKYFDRYSTGGTKEKGKEYEG